MNRRTTREDSGVLAKFRELPGARLAVAAFLVTVVVGLGGPPAYAWWSQQGNAEITATAVVLAAPALECKRDPRQQGNNGSRDTEVSWRTNGAHASSSYIMDITVLTPNGKNPVATRSYLLPFTATPVKLANLTGLDDWFAEVGSKNNDKFSLTVRNVWVNPPATGAGFIPASEAAKYPVTAESLPLEMQFKGNKDGYHC